MVIIKNEKIMPCANQKMNALAKVLMTEYFVREASYEVGSECYSFDILFTNGVRYTTSDVKLCTWCLNRAMRIRLDKLFGIEKRPV